MRNRTLGHHYGPWMAPFPGHFGVAVAATAAMSGRRSWRC